MNQPHRFGRYSPRPPRIYQLSWTETPATDRKIAGGGGDRSRVPSSQA